MCFNEIFKADLTDLKCFIIASPLEEKDDFNVTIVDCDNFDGEEE